MHIEDDPILWNDPLWSALEWAIRALTDHPQSALGYRRNTEDGLNIIAINGLAKDAKLSGRPVFKVWEDKGKDGRVVRRWLQVNHPGAADPMTNVKIFESICPTPIRPSIVDRIIAYLKAWQTAQAEQLKDAADDPRLNSTEKAIVDALRQHGQRLTTEPLLRKALSVVNSNGKSTLASMRKRGIIDNFQDVTPPGYGLPKWSSHSQDRGQD